ncbi:MAG: hypothetical protein WC343_05210 [Bacilli bacterium]|jgi:hypothetical protein
MMETQKHVFKNGIACQPPTPRVTAEDVLDATVRPTLAAGRPWICAVAGPTAEARRAVAVALATRIDPTFTSKRVVTSTEDFLGAFPACPAGGVIVFDVPEEPAAGRATDKVSAQLGPLLSVLRYTQVGAILLIPEITRLDASARRRLDAYLYTAEPDPALAVAREAVGAVWYEVRNALLPRNPGNDQVLFVHPTVNGVKIRTVWFPVPDAPAARV